MPDPSDEPGEDLVAVGADLEPGTLLAAYRAGLFPMPVDPHRRRVEDGVVLARPSWHHPARRAARQPVAAPEHAPTSRSGWTPASPTSCEPAATRIGRAAGSPSRSSRPTPSCSGSGWGHSVEVFRDGELVGGLYGVRIERFFAGESMFHTATDASKIALVALVDWLNDTGAELLDVQWVTDHLATLGAVAIPRPEYLARLHAATAARRPHRSTGKCNGAGGPPPPAPEHRRPNPPFGRRGFPPEGNLAGAGSTKGE